jgi:tRNA A37 threonylcarbamoyladenosine dehydratase
MDTQRIEMLIGKEALAKLQAARVAVVGLGGVGSYVAEALVRSGIGHIRIIDGDVVESSNVNRQLPALSTTIGSSKVEVMGTRLWAINPECNIEKYDGFYKPGNFQDCLAGHWDYIADAIDDVKAKVDLMAACYSAEIPIISAMGTGNKLDPTKLKVADISETKICPLAKVVRKSLRDLEIFSGINVVYSEEEPKKLTEGHTPASMVFVPACAGMIMASKIVRDIIGKK